LDREYTNQDIVKLFGPSEEGIFKKLLPDCWQKALDDYLAEYEKAQRDCAPFPGIKEALALLQEKQLRLAIVSGKGPGSMHISLHSSGLADFFEPVITGSEESANKPSHIRQVLRMWNLAPEEVAYMGDIAYDIEAAREVGTWPVGALWADAKNAQKVKNAKPLAAFEDANAFIQWIQKTI
jgi:Predicted phosphatases